MKAAILDACENVTGVLPALKRQLAEREVAFSYFDLKQMNIQPCRSCGSCGLRTPGRCVQKDDMPQVMRSIAESYLLVYITPIRFGGYSSQLKKAIDRTMPLGEPFYITKGTHLLHPMRYGEKFLLGIGLSEEAQKEEEANFRLVVARNGANMQSRFKAQVFHPTEDCRAVEHAIEESLREVDRA